jgi:hypothetical protein
MCGFCVKLLTQGQEFQFHETETLKSIISKPGGLDVETNRDRDRERP